MHDTVLHSIMQNTWSLQAECLRLLDTFKTQNILCMLALYISAVKVNAWPNVSATCMHATMYLWVPCLLRWNSWTINFTKGSSLLLCAMRTTQSLKLYLQIFKKTILFSGFKNPYKKSAKQEDSSLFMNSILKNEEMRAENQTKIESEKTSVYAQKPRLNILSKNSISEGTLCPESGLANEDEWSPCCQICVPMVRIKAIGRGWHQPCNHSACSSCLFLWLPNP